MLQTKGLNAINRKQFREALLSKGEALIDAENEFISPDISLARPSEKVVWDGTQFVTVPANEPAWHVDYVTGEKVLLVEGEATNYVKNSTYPKLTQSGGGQVHTTTSDVPSIFQGETAQLVETLLTDTTGPSDRIKVHNGSKVYFRLIWEKVPDSISFIHVGLRNVTQGLWVGTNHYIDLETSGFKLQDSSVNGGELWEYTREFEVPNDALDYEIYFYSAGNYSRKPNNRKIVHCLGIYSSPQSSPIITTGSAVTRAADAITYTGDPITTTQLLETSSGTVATDSGLPLNTQEAAIQKLTKLPITLTELGSSRFNSGLDEEDYFEEIAP